MAAAAAFSILATVDTPSAAAQAVTIGEGLSLGWAQFFVADADKLWQKEGLSPNSITFASGRLVLDAVAGDRVLIGTAAETPVVFAALNGVPVRIVATTNNGNGAPYEPFELVANQSIRTAADIKGKRIGYSQGTNAHYYLSKLLEKQGLKWSDITAVSLSPGDFVSSLVNGSLDAFVWTEPAISQAVTQGRGKFHTIATPGLYHAISAVITLQSTIDKHPDLLRRALLAVRAADAANAADPSRASALVAQRVNFDPALAARYWPKLNLGLGIDKASVVRELESQARWAIDNKLVRPGARIPDFNQVVVTGILDSIR
ncbi:sulfonate ABC transporter substrate-binding protein [Pandoraea communis]|uniref:Sulfonate ABC transporter substrate-binding protein n=1 Tax=Pandoraea communis TaxID=2508297 RepID=A0A5E4YQR8_9BURK|nr:NrtA/SsuA/CpmA family ABC transporter substrate-binding protein [Pandoraea communis]VVE51136.1 sulfonate ABC transporter substrate-binding protein [Pandoraea communis]